MASMLSLILCNGFFSKWSSTFAINADQFLCIKRNAAELQAGAAILGGQNRIFRPGIGMKIVIRLVVAVCKADAAGVEEKKLANPTDLLGMGVATGQNLTCICAEKFLKFFLWRGGQNHIIKGGGGAVKA